MVKEIVVGELKGKLDEVGFAFMISFFLVGGGEGGRRGGCRKMREGERRGRWMGRKRGDGR